MKITNQHIEFAKLSYEDELTDAVIAKRLGITERTVNNWNANSEIQKLIEQLGQRDINKARRILKRTASKAADTLKSCLTCGEPETCRKSACNILESTELKQAEGRSTSSGILIYLPDNQRQTKDKEKEDNAR